MSIIALWNAWNAVRQDVCSVWLIPLNNITQLFCKFPRSSQTKCPLWIKGIFFFLAHLSKYSCANMWVSSFRFLPSRSGVTVSTTQGCNDIVPHGTVSCACELETWCHHVSTIPFERVGIIRYNCDLMLKFIECAGADMVASGTRKNIGGLIIPLQPK